MRIHRMKIAQIAGVFVSLLVLTSCCLFAPPKDPNKIQDPPPTGRDYIACQVNGKPVVFRGRIGSILHQRFSKFEVERDSVNNKTSIDLKLMGENRTAFEQMVRIVLTQKFTINGNLIKEDSIQFEKEKIMHAYYWIYKQGQLAPPIKPEIDGFIRITDFERRPSENSPEGYTIFRISGVFEFSCNVLDPQTEEVHRYQFTNGVFNVIN